MNIRRKLVLIFLCILIVAGIMFRDMQILKEKESGTNKTAQVPEEKPEKQEELLHNVWITKSTDNNITVVSQNKTTDYPLLHPLSEEVEGVIGDIRLTGGYVAEVSVKPDIISGKVDSVTEKGAEIEGYGYLDFDDNYTIYKINGDKIEHTGSGILVGYDITDFVVSKGKICSAIICREPKVENIRVLVKNNAGQSVYHTKIQLQSTSKLTVEYGKEKKEIASGKKITITKNSKWLAKGTVKIKPQNKNGKIEVLSESRGNQIPKYRGIFEISLKKEGLTLINELPIEDYLCAVVPSEMPVSHGLEALKVQAVCARSYAYRQLLSNAYASLGAHVDDSTSYQVYNIEGEHSLSNQAVKETYGQVLKYKDTIIPAYYFSTSCGYTSSAYEVWMGEKNIPYLTGKYQTAEKLQKGEKEPDISKESAFRKFIQNTDVKTYDSPFAWYRWKVTIEGKELKRQIDRSLKRRYEANPKLIMTKGKDGSYTSVPVDTVGDVKSIKIKKRGTGGIVTQIVINGTQNTVKVSSEYNIRSILAPAFDTIIRQDDSKVTNLAMLPSGFFYLDTSFENGVVSAITIHGGGYGHGVGMSQNGVKTMTEYGFSYEDILKHYYTGTQIAYLYQPE